MNYSAALLCIAVSLTAAVGASAQPSISDNRPLTIGAVAAVSPTVARFGRAEFTIDLQGTYSNAFDPEEIDVTGVFTSPDGALIALPAFYFQDYTRQTKDSSEGLSASGDAGWRLRFAPTQTGRYKLTVTARDKSGTKVASEPITFECTASADPGFIRRSPDSARYFQFDSGKPYFPIGANVCWGGSRATLDYDDWLPRLSDAGCDYFRVFLGPGWTTFGLERTGEGFGLGKFDQEKAWRLDCVLDLARQRGLYVMLCAIRATGPHYSREA